MATRGQLLRSYISQFGEILVTNRKLQVEAGINRVQEQVAKGLVTPPTDEPLRDNRLYKSAWRDARAENMGREAGRLLMDDVPAMIAETMQGYRYDQDGETPSERMTYMVDEWWKKHKRNVGFEDLSVNPNYTKQWESSKTRAYGALRDVVQTETTKQALNEARGVIQTRLGQIGVDAPMEVSQSVYYKDIRDELVGMNYPLIRSQIEGLLHDEVVSNNMDTLNDPGSTQDQWLESLTRIQSLDEKGFADNGMSLSEIITGSKSPESEASTRALKAFNARMEGQKNSLNSQKKTSQDQVYRELMALSDEQFAQVSRGFIARNAPAGNIKTLLDRWDKVRKKDPIKLNPGMNAEKEWIYNKIGGYLSEMDLWSDLKRDSVLGLEENEDHAKAVVQAFQTLKKDREEKRQAQELVQRQRDRADSITPAQLLNTDFDVINVYKQADNNRGILPRDEVYLRSLESILKKNKIKRETIEQNAAFIEFLERGDKLRTTNTPDLRTQMINANLTDGQIKDVLAHRKVFVDQNKLDVQADKNRIAVLKRREGRNSFGYMNFVSPEFGVQLAQAAITYGLKQEDLNYLKEKSKRLKELEKKHKDHGAWQKFTGMVDDPNLWKLPNSEFLEAIKPFDKEMKTEIKSIRDKQMASNTSAEEQRASQLTREAAQKEWAKLSLLENKDALLKLDLTKLDPTNPLLADEGSVFYDRLVELKRTYQKTDNDAIGKLRNDRARRRMSELTGDSEISQALLLLTNLTPEWAVANNISKDQLGELLRRQELVRGNYDEESLKAISEDNSKIELVRIQELPDAEILEIKVSENPLLTNKSDQQKVLDLQRSIVLRNQQIETESLKETRSFWHKTLLAESNRDLLMMTDEESLVKLLGDKTPELAEVRAVRGEEQYIRSLPETVREFERRKYTYLRDPDLASHSIEKIQKDFPDQIEGNTERRQAVLDEQTRQLQEVNNEKRASEKAEKEKEPARLRIDYEKQFTEIMINPNLTRKQIITQTNLLRNKIDDSSDELGDTHFLPLNEKIRNLLKQINSEDPQYSKVWRPHVTKLFNERIKYTFDDYVFYNTQGGDSTLTNKLRVLRQKAADSEVLHRHMMEQFTQNGEQWSLDDVEKYLYDYLGLFSKEVEERLTTITGLEGRADPMLNFERLSPKNQMQIDRLNNPSSIRGATLLLRGRAVEQPTAN